MGPASSKDVSGPCTKAVYYSLDGVLQEAVDALRRRKSQPSPSDFIRFPLLAIMLCLHGKSFRREEELRSANQESQADTCKTEYEWNEQVRLWLMRRSKQSLPPPECIIVPRQVLTQNVNKFVLGKTMQIQIACTPLMPSWHNLELRMSIIDNGEEIQSQSLPVLFAMPAKKVLAEFGTQPFRSAIELTLSIELWGSTGSAFCGGSAGQLCGKGELSLSDLQDTSCIKKEVDLFHSSLRGNVVGARARISCWTRRPLNERKAMHAVRVDEEPVLFIDNEESAPPKSPRLKAQHDGMREEFQTTGCVRPVDMQALCFQPAETDTALALLDIDESDPSQRVTTNSTEISCPTSARSEACATNTNRWNSSPTSDTVPQSCTGALASATEAENASPSAHTAPPSLPWPSGADDETSSPSISTESKDAGTGFSHSWLTRSRSEDELDLAQLLAKAVEAGSVTILNSAAAQETFAGSESPLSRTQSGPAPTARPRSAERIRCLRFVCRRGGKCIC